MPLTHQGYDPAQLRSLLREALTQADECDTLVAIHVATALALLDERYPPDQSSVR